MDFKNYGIIYLLVFFVIVVFIFTRLFPEFKFNSITRPTTTNVATDSATNSVIVMVDFGFGGKSYTSITAPNAYLALVEAVKGEEMEVGTRQGPNGLEVVKVGDVETGSAGRWIYVVNGTQMDTAPDTRLILAGDTVEWKFVKNQ